MSVPAPDLAAIRAAAVRIKPWARVTPLLHWDALDAELGATLLFKPEQLQRSGAFKFRGACNAVFSLDEAQARRGVVTHSSGNHGGALARAAQLRGIPANVVVPEGATQAKLEAIVACGARITRCAPTQAAREEAAEALRQRTGATLVHPYTDPAVMAGQGTVALELLEQSGGVDTLLVPVGGGGLASGCAIAGHGINPRLRLFAAEPAGAADALASLRAGHHVTDIRPDTICDGLRATIGEVNFDCLRQHQVEVLAVDDNETLAAMRRVARELKQVIEPSSATVVAALLRHRQRFAGQRVGVVLSGGNVDLAAWAALVAG
ncbi:MAG TPA: pyridoxal-phosphate dependent enzyme [Rhodanobacteraceae bacterium]|nr:pyridoxal-phosphate dependent enzyme [Rhodanobacteraceae bacterium]